MRLSPLIRPSLARRQRPSGKEIIVPPTAFVFEADGMTQEQYDEAIRGMESGGLTGSEGLLAHVAGPTERGWRVVDVWESQDAADALYNDENFQAMMSGFPMEVRREAWAIHRLDGAIHHGG
jgi:hypothetical protein